MMDEIIESTPGAGNIEDYADDKFLMPTETSLETRVKALESELWVIKKYYPIPKKVTNKEILRHQKFLNAIFSKHKETKDK